MTNENDPDQPPAAEAALDETSLDEAIGQLSKSVSSDTISRSGIQKLRVLSESNLEKLVYDLVTTRVKARLKTNEASNSPSHREGPQDLSDNAGHDRKDDAQHGNPATHYAKLWESHRDKQLGRLQVLEGRIEKIGTTFTRLENSVEQVLKEIAKRSK